ncbi:MAG: hypothetical protein ABW360_18100 [Phenylobacterium sp.]
MCDIGVMSLWGLFIPLILLAMVAAFFWGRPGAILGWLAGWLAILGGWMWSMAQGDDAGWGFTIFVMIGGGIWAVIGAVAAASGLSLRALGRGEDETSR